MPRILITGNGFDLHHGLPTKYEDFINIVKYLLNNEDYSFESVYGNIGVGRYENLKEKFKDNWVFDKKRIEEIKSIATENQLYKFFKAEKDIDTWIDFENRLEYLLNSLNRGIKSIEGNLFSKGNNSMRNLRLDFLNSKVEDAYTLNFFNIISSHYPATLEPFDIQKKYQLERYLKVIGIDKEKLLTDLYDFLLSFIKLFSLYLETFVIPLIKNQKADVEKEWLNKIDYYFTFNYTPTIEELYKPRRLIVNYLHGRSQIGSENIVMGINEIPESDIEDKKLLKFTKYYQKFAFDTDYSFLNEEILNSSISNFIFYFWGHSLDLSDATYINEVFDSFEKLKEKAEEIIIIYHNSKNKLLENLLKIRGRKDIEKRMRDKSLLFMEWDSDELKTSFEKHINHGGVIEP